MSYATAAKHLEPLKGGKIPVEILAITKDPEQKAKAFEKCLGVIKEAGVRPSITITVIYQPRNCSNSFLEKGWHFTKRHRIGSFCR